MAPELPSAHRLLALVEKMPECRVVILADLVADRYVTGTPKRISREAPVLILRQDGEEVRPGGGANAVANVAALGGLPWAWGIVGEDIEGDALLKALQLRSVDTARIERWPRYATPTKTRVLGGGRHAIKQQIVRFDREDFLELGSETRRSLEESLVARGSTENDVVILSDYGYGAVDPTLVESVRRALPRAILVCDSRFRLDTFRGLDGATPNEEEAERLLGRSLGHDDEEIASSVLDLRDHLGTRHLLVTRGSSGMCLAEHDSVAMIPIHGGDEVADVTGAGDTVIATFALALSAGGTPAEAALLANYAGGVVVMKIGTATVSPDELESAIRRDPRPRKELRWVG